MRRVNVTVSELIIFNFLVNMIYRHNKEVDEHVAVLLHYQLVHDYDIRHNNDKSGRIGFQMDLWNPCIVIDLSREQFLYSISYFSDSLLITDANKPSNSL
jgi:hypothetical protein